VCPSPGSRSGGQKTLKIWSKICLRAGELYLPLFFPFLRGCAGFFFSPPPADVTFSLFFSASLFAPTQRAFDDPWPVPSPMSRSSSFFFFILLRRHTLFFPLSPPLFSPVYNAVLKSLRSKRVFVSLHSDADAFFYQTQAARFVSESSPSFNATG